MSAPETVADFFRHHGWLAPGVRLFRRIGFPAKAMCVALAFILPLAMLLWFVWTAAQDQIEFAQSEREGLTYMRPLQQLVQAAQSRRRAATAGAADLAALQQQVQAAFDAVRARQAALGERYGTQQRFAELQAAHDALLHKPAAATPDETFEAHGRFIAQMLQLMRDVADQSKLVLDPDLDTFHMMELSVLLGPVLQENMARLRGLGNAVLQSQERTPQHRDQMLEWRTLAAFLVKNVESAFQRGIGFDAELARQFDMQGTAEASREFLAAVQRQLLGPELAGDAAGFLRVANMALDSQYALSSKVLERLDTRLQARIDQLNATLSWQVCAVVVSLLLAAYLLLSFYRVMMGGLREVARHLDAISAGDLTTVPRPWGRDEAAQLMDTLHRMQINLRRVVATVLDSSVQVQSSSEEIAAATHDLSQRTEQAAANLEETAASTEQITSTVKQTADTVHSAMAIVRDNTQAATRGGQVIDQVVTTMHDIRSSSSRIGEIIGVIDGIAFQTNILALNAAVEAARAGEQGRGFAVVASEVRALAGRSAAAAREIKGLITTSIAQVESGSQVVADAGQRVREVVGNADRIAGLMEAIATATREQSAGVDQVGSAVQDLDRSTQQNAALVEQTAAATASLTALSGRLAAEVSFFRLPSKA